MTPRAFVAMCGLYVAGVALAGCGASPPAAPQAAQPNPATQAATGQAPASPDGAPSIVGAWSGQVNGPDGLSHAADLYNPDGTFVSVSQAPNGTVQRVWGRYQATPVSPSQITLQFQVQGFLPQQICAQAPGFPMRCSQNSLPPPTPETVVLTSPTTVQANGITMQRDNAPALLQQNVPEQLVMNAQAPVQPNMQQPVMPGGARYDSAPAQNFINGYMRGCTQNAQGQWVGCQQ